MCELTEKLRSYNPTSGYSTTMRRAAEEIDMLRDKLSVEDLSDLIWRVSYDEPDISFERADELAKFYLNQF